jgi:hypothetical protein
VGTPLFDPPSSISRFAVRSPFRVGSRRKKYQQVCSVSRRKEQKKGEESRKVKESFSCRRHSGGSVSIHADHYLGPLAADKDAPGDSLMAQEDAWVRPLAPQGQI